jgi:hypothetical protein
MISKEIREAAAAEYRAQHIKQRQSDPERGSGLADPLRRDFIHETAEFMQSHITSFMEAIWRGSDELADNHWECARLCGQSISKTFNELKRGKPKSAPSAEERKDAA